MDSSSNSSLIKKDIACLGKKLPYAAASSQLVRSTNLLPPHLEDASWWFFIRQQRI